MLPASVHQAMPFSALKNIFFDVDIVVKNKSIVVYHRLYSYLQVYLSSQWVKFVVDSVSCALRSSAQHFHYCDDGHSICFS